MKMKILFLTALALLAAACGGGKEYAPQEVAPVYDIVYQYGMADYVHEDSIMQAAGPWLPELNAFLETVHDGNVPDSLQLRAWARSLPVRVFTPAVDSVFSSTDGIEADLGYILGAARDAGLDLPHRRYAAIVHGKMESVLFTDSVMLIALNHYLGPEYPGYESWPIYMRMMKSPEQLPYDIAEALIATAYPYQPDSQPTVLKRMLYEGALAYAKMQVVKDASEARALSMPQEHYQYAKENEAAIWETLVSRNLLFDTSASTVSRLFDPAPTTPLIGTYAPGRVVRYNALRLVRSYIKKHPSTSLHHILTPDFYNNQSTLAQSDYHP